LDDFVRMGGFEGGHARRPNKFSALREPKAQIQTVQLGVRRSFRRTLGNPYAQRLVRCLAVTAIAAPRFWATEPCAAMTKARASGDTWDVAADKNGCAADVMGGQESERKPERDTKVRVA